MNEYEFIFFYRYEDGAEGFGYYGTEEEADERMKEFAADTKHYTESRVEYGVAQIMITTRNYIPDCE